MAELKYEPAAHDREAFLNRARGRRGFQEAFDALETEYQVTNELKSMIRLEKHNLLEDSFPVRVDMILCRNVVIYFNEASKRELFIRFGAVLEKEGILMIGASERIPNPDEANLRSLEPFFYARKDSSYPKLERRRFQKD